MIADFKLNRSIIEYPMNRGSPNSDAEGYVLNVLSPTVTKTTNTLKRSSEDSDPSSISPSTSSPPKKMSNMENVSTADSIKLYMEELKSDFKHEFRLLREEYKRDFSALQTNVTELKERMCTMTELKSAQTNLLLEVSGVKATVDDISSKFTVLKKEYDEKIRLEHELASIKADGLVNHAEFPVETTCVVSGMKYEAGKNLKERCTELIKAGLNLHDVEIMDQKRVGMYDGKPGIVKLQLRSLNEKTKVLRCKGKLLESDRKKGLHMKFEIS